jgi:hypothetical protein
MPIQKSIEVRLHEFVAAFGDVPPQARRLEDHQAKLHRDLWVQRLVGEGIACHHVVCYHFEIHWWTFCFDHRDQPKSDGLDDLQEHWIVEAYDSRGGSWRASFLYDLTSGWWQRDSTSPSSTGSHLMTDTTPFGLE